MRQGPSTGDKVTCEERPEGSEEGNHAGTWGRAFRRKEEQVQRPGNKYLLPVKEEQQGGQHSQRRLGEEESFTR